MSHLVQKGFTLIEVLIGLMLVSIAIVGVTSQMGFLQSQHNGSARNDAQAKTANMIMQDISYIFSEVGLPESTISVIINSEPEIRCVGNQCNSTSLITVGDLVKHSSGQVLRLISVGNSSNSLLDVIPVDSAHSLSNGEYIFGFQTYGKFLGNTSQVINLKTDTLASVDVWLVAPFDNTMFTKWTTQGIDKLNLSSGELAQVSIDVYDSDNAHRKVIVTIGNVTLTKVLNVPGY